MFFKVSESRNQASTPHYYEKSPSITCCFSSVSPYIGTQDVFTSSAVDQVTFGPASCPEMSEEKDMPFPCSQRNCSWVWRWFVWKESFS